MTNTTENRGIAFIILEGGITEIIDTYSSGNITSEQIVADINNAIESNMKFVQFGNTLIEVDKVWIVQDIDTKARIVINEENKVPSIKIEDMDDEYLKDVLYSSLLEAIDDEQEYEFTTALVDELAKRLNAAKQAQFN